MAFAPVLGGSADHDPWFTTQWPRTYGCGRFNNRENDMKYTLVSLGVLAAVACNHKGPDAAEPSSNYEESAHSDPDETFRDPNPGADSRSSELQGSDDSTASPMSARSSSAKASEISPSPAVSGSIQSWGSPAATGKAPVASTNDKDNTGVNERDKSGATLTPMDQGNNQTDVNITQAIRKAVVAGDFSFNAKNVKIITSGGKVTLRGPVKSAQERANIVGIAKQTAGVLNVDDQIEVKP